MRSTGANGGAEPLPCPIMIVIAGHLKVKAESIDEVKAGALALVAATLKEDGCISYGFTQGIEDPTMFHFFEEWESDEALGGHFKQPHMAAFNKVVGGAIAGAPVGHRYDAENKKSLF
jgi:quinol monooxygenase YgiN